MEPVEEHGEQPAQHLIRGVRVGRAQSYHQPDSIPERPNKVQFSMSQNVKPLKIYNTMTLFPFSEKQDDFNSTHVKKKRFSGKQLFFSNNGFLVNLFLKNINTFSIIDFY